MELRRPAGLLLPALVVDSIGNCGMAVVVVAAVADLNMSAEVELENMAYDSIAVHLLG